MRIGLLIPVVVLLFACVGCGVVIQPAQQGEWSNYHDQKAQVSDNARAKPEGER